MASSGSNLLENESQGDSFTLLIGSTSAGRLLGCTNSFFTESSEATRPQLLVRHFD